MSESWKNRLWSLLLVCTFAVVLSVCNKAVNSSSDGSSSSGTAFADGSTVTISSQALPTISHFMICMSNFTNNNKIGFHYCDATDATTFQTYTINGSSKVDAIYLDDIYQAGFKPCPSNISTTGDRSTWCK